VRAVQAGAIREDVLRPAALFTQRAHLRPDLFLMACTNSSVGLVRF
jgi:hypothetical protein